MTPVPHRAKTHLGYSATPLPTGETVWRTPHGRHRVVDAHGTHHLDLGDYTALPATTPSTAPWPDSAVKLRTGHL